MKHLIIIGARGFGREIYNSAIESIGYGVEFDIKGYLDDKANALEGYEGYPAIIGTVEEYTPCEGDVFVCALGDVKWKKYYTELMLAKGGQFMSLIHKSAYISKNVKIGNDCLILADTRIHCDVTIGNHVTIQPKAIIGHDVVIEDWCLINALADCGGFSHMEEGATIHTTSFLLPKKRMGAYSVLGAGSVAARNVKPGTVVMGVPAKEMILPKMPSK